MDYNQLKAIEASWNQPTDNFVSNSGGCGAWGEPISTAPIPILEAPKVTPRPAPPAISSQLEGSRRLGRDAHSPEQPRDPPQPIRTAPASKLSSDHQREAANYLPNPNHFSAGSSGDSHQVASPAPHRYSSRNDSTAPSASNGSKSGVEVSTLVWHNHPTNLDTLGVMRLFSEAKGVSGIRIKSIGTSMHLTFESGDLARRALQLFRETRQQGTLVPVLDEPSSQGNHAPSQQYGEAARGQSRSRTSSIHSNQNIRTAGRPPSDGRWATPGNDRKGPSNFCRNSPKASNWEEPVNKHDWQSKDPSGREPPTPHFTPGGFSQNSVNTRSSNSSRDEHERASDRQNATTSNSQDSYESLRPSDEGRNSQRDNTSSGWNAVAGTKPPRPNWNAHANEHDFKPTGAQHESFYGGRAKNGARQEPFHGTRTKASGMKRNDPVTNVKSSCSGWDAPIQTEPPKAGWDAPIESEPPKAGWDAPIESEPPKAGWDAPNSSCNTWQASSHNSVKPDKLCIQTDDLLGMAVLTPTILYLKFNSPNQAENASQKYSAARLRGFSQIVEPPSYVHFVTKDQMSEPVYGYSEGGGPHTLIGAESQGQVHRRVKPATDTGPARRMIAHALGRRPPQP
ncbi:hypothetical protein L0F63_006628 [Massospora cicadina]|nr:hypothetical protein L0F63_006628 [Massospora cicadina]